MKKTITCLLSSVLLSILLSSCYPFNQTVKVREGEYLIDLFTPKYDNSIGVEDADIAVIVFTDYNCKYCKDFNVTVKKVLKKCKNFKVIFIDYPKLGSTSTFAAKAAIAAAKQGKYIEAHNALLSSKEKYKDDFSVLQILEKAGIDIKVLGADIQNPGIDKILLQNLLEGSYQSIKYVPTVIVGSIKNESNSTILTLPSKSKLESIIKSYSDSQQ